MKKSLLTVLTFALCLANMVMTTILTITVVPQAKNANALIQKVCEAIELDIASSSSDESSVPLDQLETYELATSEDTLTINLKKGEDGEAHFAVLQVSLSINTQSKVYDTYGTTMDNYKPKMKSIVTGTMSAHTLDEIQADTFGVQTEIKDKLNAMFGSSDYIVSVDFPGAQYQ